MTKHSAAATIVNGAPLRSRRSCSHSICMCQVRIRGLSTGVLEISSRQQDLKNQMPLVNGTREMSYLLVWTVRRSICHPWPPVKVTDEGAAIRGLSPDPSISFSAMGGGDIHLGFLERKEGRRRWPPTAELRDRGRVDAEPREGGHWGEGPPTSGAGAGEGAAVEEARSAGVVGQGGGGR